MNLDKFGLDLVAATEASAALIAEQFELDGRVGAHCSREYGENGWWWREGKKHLRCVNFPS